VHLLWIWAFIKMPTTSVGIDLHGMPFTEFGQGLG